MDFKYMRYLKTISLIIIVAFFISCTDNDIFSLSPNNKLKFSVDTVKLDTTFSNVPTPTKKFWVYNYSGNGIKINKISLSQGNQTGYRVNIDGISLNQSNGWQVKDIELKNKDSIRIFVELTSPETGEKKPILITDNLIFKLESGTEQKVNLKAFSWDAILTDNIVEIDKDSLIQNNKPIVINKGINIKEGATLTIEKGTTIYFANKAGIDVHGKLIIKGEKDNEVTLRGNRLDKMFDYLPYNNVSGQWKGIHFYKTSYGNNLNFMDLHSAYNGIEIDSSNIDKEKLIINNSTVHNCQGFGIKSTSAYITINNSLLSNSQKPCIFIIGGKVFLNQCTIAQFYPFEGGEGNALSFGTKSGKWVNKLVLLKIRNSIVTGYADDVISLYFDDKTVQNYLFDHCLIRANKPKDNDKLSKYISTVWEDLTDTIHSGKKNFKLVDIEKQRYDFQLNKNSLAIDKGAVLPDNISKIDRIGRKRTEKPDLGCYEYFETNNK